MLQQRKLFPLLCLAEGNAMNLAKVNRMDVQYNSTLETLERLRFESIAAGGN
jgi:hypothetical protein